MGGRPEYMPCSCVQRHITVSPLLEHSVSFSIHYTICSKRTNHGYSISSPHLPSASIARANTLHDSLSSVLKSCEWDNYILVSQPSQTAADFTKWGAYPHMRRWLDGKDENIKTATAVPEVVGEINIDSLAKQLELECKASVEDVDASAGYVPIGDDSKRIMKIVFPNLPSLLSDRAAKVVEHDSFLNAVLSGMQDQSYIIFYTSTPPSAKAHPAPEHELHLYEMDESFPSALHIDLKRDVEAHQSNSTVNSTLPLFEKYQYFTPGMSLSPTFLLVQTTLTLSSDFHEHSGVYRPFLDPLRWSISYRRSASLIFRFQQGNGPYGTEEATAVRL